MDLNEWYLVVIVLVLHGDFQLVLIRGGDHNKRLSLVGWGHFHGCCCTECWEFPTIF